MASSGWRTTSSSLSGIRANPFWRSPLFFRDVKTGFRDDAIPGKFVCRIDETVRLAQCSGSSGSADAVDISLDLIGHVVVDDAGDRFYVESPGSHVSRDQCRNLSISEAFQNLESAFLIMVAMQGSCRVTATPEVSVELDDRSSGVTEDDAGLTGMGFEKLVNPVLLGVVLTANELLIDFRIGGHLRDRRNRFRVPHEAACQRFDLGWKCGTEKAGLSLRWSVLKDIRDVIDEAHPQHLVAFIEHQRGKLIEH